MNIERRQAPVRGLSRGDRNEKENPKQQDQAQQDDRVPLPEQDLQRQEDHPPPAEARPENLILPPPADLPHLIGIDP
jgi:hypothetical protein